VRVLYVIDALGEGGTESSLADLLQPLADRGVQSTIAILKSRGEEGVEQSLRRRGVDVRVLRPGGLFGQVRALRSTIRDVRPDLVHSMLFASDLRARIVRARGGPPLVNSIVNTSYVPERLVNPELSARKLAAVRLVDKATARWVDRFHAVSQPVAEHTASSLGVPSSMITVIERGRDGTSLGKRSEERRTSAREALALTGESFVIANLARHEHQKGIDTLLRATACISGDLDVVVVQAGRDGRATTELRTLHAVLELGDRFRFLGHRKDVGDILAAADVFAFPSRYEGMPGAVIEALALGLPVVASDIGTVTSILDVNENALVFPADDAEALADRFRELALDSVRRAAMGRRSRALFEERFTMDLSADAMAQLYDSVVERARPGSAG
jgi:glycosyltransferase involved in cell wall biosynthesis